MSYPKSLSYKINRLGNGLFQKQTLKIIPDKETITPNSTVSWKLPPNSVLDLRSFHIFFQGTTNDIGTANAGAIFHNSCFPRNVASLIEQLSISINGYQVENIQSYGHLYNILRDWSSSIENDTQRFLTNADPSKDYTIADNGDIAAVNRQTGKLALNSFQTNKKMAITDFIGLLGSSSGEYLDTNLTGEVIITIRFAGPEVLFKSNDDANAINAAIVPPTYTLSSCYATISRVMLDPLYYELMSSQVMNSGLQIGFTSFSTHWGGLTNKTQNFSFNTTGSSIRYIIGTLVYGAYTTLTKIQNGNTALSFSENVSTTASTDYFNQSVYFRKDGVNVATSAFDVNNVQMSAYPLPVEEVFLNNELAFNQQSDLLGGKHFGLHSLAAFQKYYFFHCQSLEFRNADGFTISGLDTKNASANIVFKTTLTGGAANANIYPLVFVAKDLILNINAGRQVFIQS